jgi:hypothetical protein
MPPDAPFLASRGHPLRFNPAMTEPPLEPWMTSSRGPFLTLNAGGPLSGIVTITALPEQGAHLVVEGNWRTIHGEPRTASAAIEGYNAARKLAHEWADQLAAGHEPTSLAVWDHGL